MNQVMRKTPVKLILDTDMLTDCDDAAAMSLLHALADNGEVEILATMVSSKYPMSAAVVDVVNTFHNRPHLPVGAPKNGAGVYNPNSVFLDKVAAEFPHKVASNDEAHDAVTLYRQILASHDDQSVKIATIGYMSNLENLLKSEPDHISPLNGVELVKQKVAEWVCMGGNFPVDPAKDNVNFTRDGSAAVYTIRNWPGKVTFCGREVGHNIHVGEKLKETPVSNPTRRAYELHRGTYNKAGHWNHHTADPTTLLYAVRGHEGYWDIEEGEMDIQEDCSFVWTPISGSRYSRLLQVMDRQEMGALMEELFTRAPQEVLG